MYQEQKYNKPLVVFDITDEFEVNEIGRSDASGKEHVLQFRITKDSQVEWISASTETQYNQWLKAFQNIKN